jgi:hypothetical protein
VTDPEFHSEPPPASAVDDANSLPPMQTFVFSATLSKELQQNLKKRWRPKGPQKNSTPASTLDDLLSRLDFRDPEPEIVDISPRGGIVPTLKESRIECLATDKVRVLRLTCPLSDSPAAGCLSVLFSSAIPRAHACVHVVNRRDSQISASSWASWTTHVPTSLPARATTAS